MYHLIFLLQGCDYGMGTQVLVTYSTLNLRLRTSVKYDMHMWGLPAFKHISHFVLYKQECTLLEH
jgi:hypothetical protein